MVLLPHKTLESPGGRMTLMEVGGAAQRDVAEQWLGHQPWPEQEEATPGWWCWLAKKAMSSEQWDGGGEPEAMAGVGGVGLRLCDGWGRPVSQKQGGTGSGVWGLGLGNGDGDRVKE